MTISLIDHLNGMIPTLTSRGFDYEANVIRRAIAEIERLRAAVEGGNEGQWQPIETAPHDVRGLVYFNCDVGKGVSMGRVYRYGDEVRGSAEGFHGDWNVTHWRPLPDAPDCGVKRGANPPSADNLEAGQGVTS